MLCPETDHFLGLLEVIGEIVGQYWLLFCSNGNVCVVKLRTITGIDGIFDEEKRVL